MAHNVPCQINAQLKSLERLKKSLSSIKTNIEELSSFPSFNITLNMEALLTLQVENQHAVTHFKRDSFTLYEYALMFGTSVEEAVKRISKWAAAYYTHPNSYYKLPTSHAVSLQLIKVPKLISQEKRASSNEGVGQDAWQIRQTTKFKTR